MQRAARRTTVRIARRHFSFFEWRTDVVQPARMAQHVQMLATRERQQALPGWLGMWTSSIGGDSNSLYHLYGWDDYDQREAACARAPALMGDGVDTSFAPAARFTSASRSVAMVEATAQLGCHLAGAKAYTPPPVAAAAGSARVVWELRTYQLRLGYGTVPRFVELYADGLADKQAVDTSGASELVTLLHSDSGSLNVVIELWRHASMQRSQESRQQSRNAARWRQAVNEIAQLAVSFETQFIRPVPGSPWQ